MIKEQLRLYVDLIKPGIILGNLLTLLCGFLMGSSSVNIYLLMVLLLATTCVIASACVINNYLDQNLDKRMKRTEKRGFARGLVREKEALCFAFCLGLLGLFLLYQEANGLTMLVALFGWFAYLFVYTLLKPKTHFATLIGSFAGAMPPLIGYVGVANRLDGIALCLFLLLVCWQMPHFFAIAFFRFEEYKAAQIPLLPIVKGSLRTKIEMLCYIAAFQGVLSLFFLFGYTSLYPFLLLFAFGSIWFYLSIAGFFRKEEVSWARQMFFYSLFIILSVSILLPF